MTNKLTAMARRHLALHGLEDRFEVVIGPEQCRRAKPHPEPFLRALEQLGVEAERAIAIGDSPHDIVAGQAAGVRTVGAAWGTMDLAGLAAANPDMLLERPEQLLILVEH